MLCDECKPPLLQNGDGLKPGDWIMVRSKECEEWRNMWIPANVKTID